MRRNLRILPAVCLFGVLSCALVNAEDMPSSPPVAAGTLRFDISSYIVEGATLLTKTELDAAVAPFVGKDKDFSDVQHALEAVEKLYAGHGYSAVHVSLPEQELEKGVVHFRVVESRYAKITVSNNRFVSSENALNALPALRAGGVPRSDQISSELKLANENPARQMNVVLKEGAKEDEVDANVLVTDNKPSAWSVTLDNSGTPETGETRTSVAYRNANLFNADHVATAEFQTSPLYPSRVEVIGAGYKIPRYQTGDSWEFFGGYSNVNSVVSGLTNFQGGGSLLSAHDNLMLGRAAGFDPKLTFGLDWRTYTSLTQTKPNTIVLYNEITSTPLSVTLSGTRTTEHANSSFNISYEKNLPVMSNGKKANFENYDPSGILIPDANYGVLRYGGNYIQTVAGDWQGRAALKGQWTSNVLVLGEQLRLGGADGVRGFDEGAEGGEKGMLANLEGYTPGFNLGGYLARGLVFYDAGKVNSNNGFSTSIASWGIGLRATHGQQITFRADMGRIINPGVDLQYHKGGMHTHASISASF